MAEVTTESLKKDLDALREDIEVLAKNLKKSTEEEVSKKFESISEELSLDELKKSIDELKLKGKQTLEGVKSKGEDAFAEVENYVKAEPLKSVAITFGVGFIFGWLMRK